MGIDAWVPRIAAPYAPVAVFIPYADQTLEVPIAGTPEEATVPPIPADVIPAVETPAPVPFPQPQPQFVPEPEPPPPILPPVPNPVAMPPPGIPCPHNWDDLAAQVVACTACPLHLTRTQTVFGVGDREARWMFIGEAPGEQEDLQGEPFVGRAGQLLNEMIRAIGLKREEVYIANILKCRPPKNRDPAPEEAAACENYLKAQLALVRPDIIVAVGRIAAQNLLKTATPIGKLRGQVYAYQEIPLVVTFHPAYLLRSQTEKRRAWDDLKLALRTFRQRQQQ
ncbi:DNA polymerase [Methylomagnum ishizawai]|uniref:Type-4 uracil-DNA glycosylase n=2 Tax=Methylomagnum ishizawai TaxID=1760988 RepID=A0A1Y6CXH9_9GAMM|nr:DNA polymerase [Methylomagnum ishizawai]